MLKTRIITAVILFVIVLAVLFGGYYPAFAVFVALFFGAAIWESFRLFKSTPRNALVIAAFWTFAFSYTFLVAERTNPTFWFALATAIWLLRFVPALAVGLPPADGVGNLMLSLVYALTIVACCGAMLALFARSPGYLLSTMALVWIADIGAYFSGKAFGKRKLAPTISPGKSWEGAFGGGIAVLVLAALSVLSAPAVPLLRDTFAVHLQAKAGWAGALGILMVIVAASIVGDLFESQLKRRAGVKDSSTLLPGHGGVLDRIDALIPVLPLAALIDAWLS